MQVVPCDSSRELIAAITSNALELMLLTIFAALSMSQPMLDALAPLQLKPRPTEHISGKSGAHCSGGCERALNGVCDLGPGLCFCVSAHLTAR